MLNNKNINPSVLVIVLHMLSQRKGSTAITQSVKNSLPCGSLASSQVGGSATWSEETGASIVPGML
jgi:hypothetical protein